MERPDEVQFSGRAGRRASRPRVLLPLSFAPLLSALLLLSLPLALPAQPPPPGASPAERPSAPEPGRDDGRRLGLLEAVALLLENDPSVARVEAQLDLSQGGLLAASGRFEPLVTSTVTGADEESPLVGGGTEDATVVDWRAGLSRQLRSGQTLSTDVSLGRDDPAGPGDAVNVGSIGFTLRQPLLRDRGREAVTAAETAAERGVEASRLDLQHTVSERVLAVVDRYWRFRATWEQLEILRQSLALSEELLATTRRLVAADLRPAADVVLLEADLAAKRASLIEGERQLFAARQNLGREIGLPPERILALGTPADPFPRPPATPRLGRDRAGAYVDLALATRADLAAARRRLAASRALERGAENDLLPRLDLVLAPRLSGVVQGTALDRFFDPVLAEAEGFSTALTLDFSFPPANRAARGALIQSQARRRIDSLDVESLRLAIGADVPSALEDLLRGAEGLEVSTRAMELFEQALTNEERKLQVGRSTLLDVISQQDRLTSARQGQVSAALGLAVALARLRFETGQLVAGDGQAPRVGIDELTTPPPLEPSETTGSEP